VLCSEKGPMRVYKIILQSICWILCFLLCFLATNNIFIHHWPHTLHEWIFGQGTKFETLGRLSAVIIIFRLLFKYNRVGTDLHSFLNPDNIDHERSAK